MVVNSIIGRWRGADALGAFNQVFAIYLVLSQLAVGGVHFSALKSISYCHDDRRRCTDIAMSALALAVALSSVLALAAWLLRGVAAAALESPSVGFGLGLAAPGLIFFSLNKTLLNVLNALSAMRAFAVFQACRFLFILSGVMIVRAANLDPTWLPASLTGAELLLFLLLAGWTHRRLLPLRFTARTASWFREHIVYGLRGSAGGLLTELNTRIDVLLLGWFMDDGAVGVFTFAAMLAEGFCQLPLVVRRNVDPLLGRMFAANDRAGILALARKAKRTTWIGMGLVSVAAVAGYPLVLLLMQNRPEFAASWSVFALLMTGILINSGYRPFLGLLLQGGHPGMHTVLTLAVVTGNVAFNLALIPLAGIRGAAIATGLAYVLEALLIAALARRQFGLRI